MRLRQNSIYLAELQGLSSNGPGSKRSGSASDFLVVQNQGPHGDTPLFLQETLWKIHVFFACCIVLMISELGLDVLVVNTLTNDPNAIVIN